MELLSTHEIAEIVEDKLPTQGARDLFWTFVDEWSQGDLAEEVDRDDFDFDEWELTDKTWHKVILLATRYNEAREKELCWEQQRAEIHGCTLDEAYPPKPY